MAEWSLKCDEIAEAAGMTVQGVGLRRRTLIARMTAEGFQVPPCRCGKAQMHRGACQPATAEDRRRIVARALAGEGFESIGRSFGLSYHQVKWILSESLSTDDLRAHWARVNASLPKPSRWGNVITLFGPTHVADDLHRQIPAHVPLGVEKHLADNAIADAYLAVLEGGVEASNLSQAVRKALTRAGAPRFEGAQPEHAGDR